MNNPRYSNGALRRKYRARLRAQGCECGICRGRLGPIHYDEPSDPQHPLSFVVDEKPVIVVMAGDGRVNSSKFKAQFHTKPSMVPRDRVQELVGFIPGGVCPFGVDPDIPVWLDVSMKRFAYVHPAGGNEYTSVKLSPTELETASDAVGWCDVCKGWEETQ